MRRRMGIRRLIPETRIFCLWLPRASQAGDIDEAAIDSTGTGRVVLRRIAVVSCKVPGPRVVAHQHVFSALKRSSSNHEDVVGGDELVAREISPWWCITAGFRTLSSANNVEHVMGGALSELAVENVNPENNALELPDPFPPPIGGHRA